MEMALSCHKTKHCKSAKLASQFGVKVRFRVVMVVVVVKMVKMVWLVMVGCQYGLA